MPSVPMLFLLGALTAEAVWETLKMVWQEKKLNVDRVGALSLGLVLAFSWPIDFFALIGYPLRVSWMGMLLTGVLLGRGSNYAHDLWKIVEAVLGLVKAKATP